MAHHDAEVSHATADDEYLNPTDASGHEHTDVNVWMIVQFAIWLIGSAVVVHLLMGLMFVWFVDTREAVSAPQFPLAVGQEHLADPGSVPIEFIVRASRGDGLSHRVQIHAA